MRRRVNLENEAHVQYSRSRAHTTSKIKPPTDVECASASMGFYAQKTQQLWGDVSLHEALNGQVGGHHSWGDHGRSAHRDWKAGYVARPSSSLAPLPGAFGDASQALFLVTRPESAGTCPKSRLSYPAPGRGANGRPCRPCAPRPGREAVAVHLFRGMQSTHSIAWAGSADVTLSFLLAFKTLARACVMRGYRDASSIGNVR